MLFSFSLIFFLHIEMSQHQTPTKKYQDKSSESGARYDERRSESRGETGQRYGGNVALTGRRKEDLMRFTLHSELTSLVEEVDKKVLIQLRDGRKLIGILRSFDQFANIVLTETVERFYLGDRYGDVKLGLFLLKGETIVLLGEVDEAKDKALPGKFTEEETPQAYKES